MGRVLQLLQEQLEMTEQKPERRRLRPLRPFVFRLSLFLSVFVGLCYTNVMAIQLEKTVEVDPESKAVEPFWMWPYVDLQLTIQPKDSKRCDIAEFCGLGEQSELLTMKYLKVHKTEVGLSRNLTAGF